MNEEMNQLIALQEIDAELAEFDRAINEQQQEISQREQSISDKEAAIAACHDKVAGLEQQQRDIAMENDDAGARIKDRQNKMMQVQTSREHQALLKEIEENKRLIKETEEKLLTITETIEQTKSEVAELENLLAGEQELLNKETTAVKKKIKQIESRRKTVAAQRKKLSAVLSATILKRYNMLLIKRDGLAVVRTINGVCQGCHMSIPPQQFNEVRKGDKLQLCPTCQRILYFQEEENEE